MYSRSGISTPVERRSTLTTIPPAVAVPKLADPLQRTINLPGDLLNEGVPPPEDLTGSIDQLIRVRCVRQILDGEDQGLREAAISCLVLISIPLDLLQDPPVGVNRRDAPLDLL